MFGPTLFENIGETVLKEAVIMNMGYKIGINVRKNTMFLFQTSIIYLSSIFQSTVVTANVK